MKETAYLTAVKACPLARRKTSVLDLASRRWMDRIQTGHLIAKRNGDKVVFFPLEWLTNQQSVYSGAQHSTPRRLCGGIIVTRAEIIE